MIGVYGIKHHTTGDYYLLSVDGEKQEMRVDQHDRHRKMSIDELRKEIYLTEMGIMSMIYDLPSVETKRRLAAYESVHRYQNTLLKYRMNPQDLSYRGDLWYSAPESRFKYVVAPHIVMLLPTEFHEQSITDMSEAKLQSAIADFYDKIKHKHENELSDEHIFCYRAMIEYHKYAIALKRDMKQTQGESTLDSISEVW
jgi:hypothetical protein